MDEDHRWRGERGRWLGRDRRPEGRGREDWTRGEHRERNTAPGEYSRYGRDEEWENRFGPEDYGGGTSRGGIDYERAGFQIRGGGREHGPSDEGRRDMERGFGQGRGFRDYGRDELASDRPASERGRQARRDFGHDYARDRARRMREDNERGWLEKTGDEIASWFGDEDAERRRRMDEERSHRGRGPRGYTRSDDRIREDVSDRLTEDHYVDASDIDVAVSGGEVTLGGHVEHRGARRRAEDIAESVSGVTHVQNNLRVRQPGGTAAGASAMAGMEGTGKTRT